MSESTADLTNNLQRHERLLAFLKHLGIKKAHFAARVPSDIIGIIKDHSEMVASLVMICPESIDSRAFGDVADRLMVVTGDTSPTDKRNAIAVDQLPGVKHFALDGYGSLVWSNVTLDRADVLAPKMLDFIEQSTDSLADPRPADLTGEVAKITYTVSGSGPPLVLLPLALTPAQWDPLLPVLTKNFTTIVLGGPELGVIPPLEDRGRAPGYLRLVSNMMNEIEIESGQYILDIGCGTGVIDRWLAHRSPSASITAVDLNAYLIREAKNLASQENLAAKIKFQQENAEKLTFSDDEFDVTISMTVMEEVNADRMLSEMVRVTKPGGRIGIIVRALDIPKWFNAPIASELRDKIEQPGEWDEGDGCASAGLYDRFVRTGLKDVKKFPDLTPFDNPKGSVEFLLQMVLTGGLNERERQQWQSSFKHASQSGTMIMTWPHHCAIGTKPA